MAPLHLLFERQFTKVPPPEGFPIGQTTSRAGAILAGNIICQTVGTLFFLARLYSRAILISTWKLEDTVLVVAWLFGTANSTMQYAQIDLGAGHHLGFLLATDPNDVVQSQKYAFASQILVIIALAAPKLSICLTYLRIFSTDAWGRRMIRVLIAMLTVPLLPFFWLSVFQCKPISAYWTEGRPASKCYDDISGLYVNGGLNIFVDLALTAIILPRVLSLHLEKQQKWALISIVTFGFVAAAAGAVRVIRVGTTVTNPQFDASWDMYDISIWTSTEIYISLICASAPGAKPVVQKLLPKLLGSTLASGESTRIPSYPPGSIEFSLSKQRRGTIGSARSRAQPHDSTLIEELTHPYEELDRSTDSVELERLGKSSQDVRRNSQRLSKISEVSVHILQTQDPR